MTFLLWATTGLATGLLCWTFLRSSGFGAVFDVVVGVGGAGLGRWLLPVPFGPRAGTVVVAFAGAAALLLGVRLARNILMSASQA
ncbi:MAG TPA: hypothetical protein VHE35_15660 [Kofleriaceae bacterium]|nr:hypothetical protein [Kofleriaceae bacterium]